MCVHMCCAGCESRVRKSLAKMEGIDGVEIDMAMQKVTVTGYAEQKKVLKAVRKTGRRAVLWPYPYHPDQLTAPFHHPAAAAASQPAHDAVYSVNPFAYSTASSSSYNYRKHGTDESMAQGYYYPAPAASSGMTMFSDENPNACSIM